MSRTTMGLKTVTGLVGIVVLAGVALGCNGAAIEGKPSNPAAAPASSAQGAAGTRTAPPASANAGGVEVLRGGIHTVHHSSAPLPTADAPRADGKPTLVWFSATWCSTCSKMAPYANITFATFQSQLAVVEKSIDHDRATASRYGVRGTPTFVLIDAQGKDIGRFFSQPDADSLAAAVTKALATRS